MILRKPARLRARQYFPGEVFEMGFPDLPFGGLFDFNGDGVMDPTEDFIAYSIIADDRDKASGKDEEDDD